MGRHGDGENGRNGDKELLSFLSEANEYFSRIQPYLIFKNYHYFTPGDIYYVVAVSNLLNSSFNHLTSNYCLSNYERLSYFNELIVKIDQIKLGLSCGNLNKTERNTIKNSLEFVLDTEGYNDYNLTVKGGSDECAKQSLYYPIGANPI